MTTAEIKQRVIAAAQQYGIDPDVALAQCQQESGFNPSAKSPVGAQGLWQFMPATWQTYGRGGNPFDVDDACQAWGRYMSHLLQMFGGRYDLALAGYNSGENRSEYKAAALENREINWQVFNTPKLRGVFTETQNYVKKILGKSGQIDFALPDIFSLNNPANDDFLIYAMIGGGLLLALLLRR